MTTVSLTTPRVKLMGMVDLIITFICMILSSVSIILIGIAMNGHLRSGAPLAITFIGGWALCGFCLMTFSAIKDQGCIWKAALYRAAHWLQKIEDTYSEITKVPVPGIVGFLFFKVLIPLVCLIISIAPLYVATLGVFIMGTVFGLFIRIITSVLGLVA
jgi:hypothetical protein